jgi:HK97 family phage major capsid protein
MGRDILMPDDKGIYFGSAVKALNDEGRVGGYLVSWGSEEDRDLQNEWFSSDTDLKLDWYEKRPALYHHGLDKTLKADGIGVIDVLRYDEDAGLWAEAQLDMHNAYVKRVLELVKQGVLSWSSGSIPHLVEVDQRGQIKCWPVVEGSLTPTPADPREVARIHSLKSLLDATATGHDDKAHGDDEPTDSDQIEAIKNEVTHPMTKEELQALAEMIAGHLNVEDDVVADVVEEVAEAHPEPEEPVVDAEEAEAASKAIVDQITNAFKAVIAKEAGRKAAAEAVKANIAAFNAGKEAESKAPESVKTNTDPTPDIQVLSKYDELNAEDMSYLASIGPAVTGFRPTQQYFRELADKAQKSLGKGEIKLTNNAIKSIKLAGDMGGGIKADEVMYSTLASYGDEWVPELWSDQLWNKARQENVILPLMRVVEMPSDPFKMPIESGDPTVYFAPETQDETQLTLSGTANPIPDSQMGTANVTLDASKLALRVGFSQELVEDSIVPLVPQLRMQATRAMADAIDHVILNADDTASGNINLDGGTPGSTLKYMAMSYGLRHTGLIDDSAGNAVSGAGARVTALLLRQLRGALPDRYASRNPRNLAYFTNYSVYSTLLGMDEVMTVDKYGSMATILTGEIPVFDGVPILVTAEMGATATNGKISSTAGNNLYGNITCAYLPGWVLGYRRRVMTRLDPVPGTDSFQMVMTARLALTRFDVNTASNLYYLAI